MKKFKLSEKRKNDCVKDLVKLLKYKTISKGEKEEIKKLIIVKRKRYKILSGKIIKSQTAHLAYILLNNLGAGEYVKMGNSKLTNYDAKDVLLVMGKIVKTAHDKKIKLK